MNSTLLLPTYFKKIGLVLFIPFSILGFFVIFNEFQYDWLTFKNLHGKDSNNFLSVDENFTNEIAIIGTLISLSFIAFSREKSEDEFIFKTRLESLLWATFINVILVVVVTLSFYSMNFYVVITNMTFVLLVVFIIRFNFILYWKPRFEAGKGGKNEE